MAPRTMKDSSRSSIAEGGGKRRGIIAAVYAGRPNPPPPRAAQPAGGFLILSQSFDRPNRYGEPRPFDTPARSAAKASRQILALITRCGVRGYKWSRPSLCITAATNKDAELVGCEISTGADGSVKL